MYIRLDLIQPRTEEFIYRASAAGKWAPNSVISPDGVIMDARLKSGLQPSPITRDLKWGVPVPIPEGETDDEMAQKVLCKPSYSFQLLPRR